MLTILPAVEDEAEGHFLPLLIISFLVWIAILYSLLLAIIQ